MKVQSMIATATIGLMISGSALACGDSLYRAGKGVSYRTYSAPLPGNLLILGNSDGARELAAELARAGHVVRLVDTTDEMNSTLASDKFDVVIAPFSARHSVESNAAASSFLPIADAGDEEQLARQSYKEVMVPEKHEIKHYLKAIHQALKDNA